MVSERRVRELFEFDSQKGVLIWKERPASDFRRNSDRALFQRNCVGRPAGTLNPDGYIRIQIDGSIYLAHVLIWVWTHGQWPEQEIDHRNHVRNDNRPSNLFEATRIQNMKNKKLYSQNKSGTAGVYQRKNRWISVIRVTGRLIHLGSFEEKNMAIEARKAAELLHGFHPNHGS